MISIIVCSNKKEVYERLLLPSIKKQKNKNYEIVLIDTFAKPIDNAGDALNYGASLAKGDIFVFCHQDIEFLREDAFDLIEEFCRNYNFGVAGVAGITLKDREVHSSVIDGYDHRQAGIKINTVEETDSLDECMFFVKKENFVKFKNYGSWHFYAVEYSLKCKRKEQKNYLLPIDIFHESPGWSLDKSYWKTLLKVAKDFKDYKLIPTTIGIFKNNHLLRLRILRNRIRIKLGLHKIGREKTNE